ncbi:bZIP transcription factor 53-like [Nicotiana tabacum]|uniref:BZIP transcription factor 53-like n=1 Tax=Nicotiana tabacum TaxID=4097 RepID=A0AC58UH16_TOBAC
MSALRQSGSSSASEGDQRYACMDEKKRKRMISNRESARRSRMRKQNLVQELTKEVSKLQAANRTIVAKIEETTERLTFCTAQNNVLRAQEIELTDWLKSLNDLINHSGLVTDVTNVADCLLKPWQITCSMQQISASSGLFQY